MSNFLGDGSADVSQEEDEGRALSSERRSRMINVFIIAPGLLSASFLISLNLKSNYYLGFIPFPQKAMLLLGFVLFLLFLGCLTLYYLQNGISFSSETRSLVSEAMGLSYKVLGLNDEGPRSDRLDSLENTVYELKNKLAGLSLGDYKELVDDEVTKIKASVDSEVWGEILKSLPKKTDQENKLLAIEREFAQSRFRLMKEVSALGLRGNVNLTLGFLTTVTGLGVLSYFIWVSAGVSQDLVSFVISFVPRLSLVIFIQVFAFFFLRLYKSGLLEIKYFQNEITNLELKFFGISTALLAESVESLAEVSKSLMESERNRILQPGQTTFELEKYKLEQNSAAEVLKILPRIIGRRAG